jgi:hypothetical protein
MVLSESAVWQGLENTRKNRRFFALRYLIPRISVSKTPNVGL